MPLRDLSWDQRGGPREEIPEGTRAGSFPNDAINQAISDSEGYYLIGYHPDSDTFDSKTGDLKFHRLQIRLRTAGLQVRSRSGFFGGIGRGRAACAADRISGVATRVDLAIFLR